MILYGIGNTYNQEYPTPNNPAINWLQKEGADLNFTSKDEALIACENDGWRGYVCFYPSGLKA